MKKRSCFKKPIYGLAMGSILATGLSVGLPTITEDAKSSISISSSKVTLKVGDKKTLKLKGVSSKKTKNITWKSSKKNIATVSSKGVVKAKKAGKCTITAKYSGNTYKCKVTVKKTTKTTESTTEATTSTTYEPRNNQMTTLYGPPSVLPPANDTEKSTEGSSGNNTENPSEGSSGNNTEKSSEVSSGNNTENSSGNTTEQSVSSENSNEQSTESNSEESTSEEPIIFNPRDNKIVALYGPPPEPQK